MSLNADLVSKITNEVINQLQGNQVTTTISQSNNRNILVILNSNLKHINIIYQQLNILKNNYNVTILLSKTAEKVLGVSNVINNTGINNVIADSGNKRSELFNYDCIILPNLTLNTLSKLANMFNDNFVTDIVINFLMNKKPVCIGLDFLNFLKSINPMATTQITENINKLKLMGAQEIKLSELGTFSISNISCSNNLNIVNNANECGNQPLCIVKNPDNVQVLLNAGADRIGSNPGISIELPNDTSSLIDHTLLKPDVTRNQIIELCEEAKKYNFASVCVNPSWVKLCSDMLKSTAVKVCTVIGFPLGATTTATKVAETQEAILNGADEIDMVINVGALKAGETDFVRNDIKMVKQATGNHILKVIIETALLTDEEKVTACRLSKEANADYVKTSTGFASGGATLADIALMRQTVGPNMGVKASGGVRTYDQAKLLFEAGATRIGASASIAIVEGKNDGGSGY